MRATLYMAPFNAMRYNRLIRAFADRLAATGKPFKVVVTAANAQAADHPEQHVENQHALAN